MTGTYLVIIAAALIGLCGAAAACAWNAHTTAQQLARAEELKARLKEIDFARETAEQSLSMLETELQRKVTQLEAAQMVVAAAASLPLPTAPPPPVPGTLTPGCGELPPPPAHLVERFLHERNAVAVDQEQVGAR